MTGDPDDPDTPWGYILEVEGESILVLSLNVSSLDLSKLTAIQREVVEAKLSGKSNAEIARDRGKSVHTIANLLAAAYRKLGVTSCAELAAKLRSRSKPGGE